jgi:hypothetical protein
MHMPPIFWTQKQDIGPGNRASLALTYDTARQRVILFGGDPGGPPLADTWAWDGDLWTQVADTGPSARRGASLVDEVALQRVLLFGGGTALDVLGDTWVCVDDEWTQVADTGPAPRVHHAMAYDSVRQRVVAFGGQAAGLFGDTWEWDGTEWTQVQDVGPVARAGHMMAFDAAGSRVVLFGGWDLSGPYSDTWAWNGTAWTQIADTGPEPRSNGGLVATAGGMLLFGGVNNVDPGLDPADRVVFGDTWQLIGDAWTKVQDIGPSARWGHGMAFRADAGRVLLFGGGTTFAAPQDSALVSGLRRDTWEVAVAAAQPGPGPDQPQPGQVEVASVNVQPDAVTNAGDVIDVLVQLTGVAQNDTTLVAAIFGDSGGGNWMPVDPPGFMIPQPIIVGTGNDGTQFPITRDSQPPAPGPYAIGVGVEGGAAMQGGFFTVN